MILVTRLSLLVYLLVPLQLGLAKSLNLFLWMYGDHFFESFDGYKYLVTFIDDFSRVTWLYILKSKSEVMEVFKDFNNLVQTHLLHKFKH